ncbi:uncharacterized protein [Physcomitrium patens]|uniref:uncharacterized protein isoform X3 n=1 Tax=Physcomitrium patens TaxID=3218 RepID=UPI003CCCE4B0
MSNAQSAHATLQKLSVASWLRAHGKFVRPELTRQQKQELKECFELIDADGSGAIDASEMLTAFNVLGMHAKKAEVEAMLAEVDADGSGEVEYPEFVQIMTTKLDQRVDQSVYSTLPEKPAKQQTLPFPLLARAYRRKKLMEAVMGGDKASQERLQARADAAELERQALRKEAASQKEILKNIQQKAFTNLASQRIRKIAGLNRRDFAKIKASSTLLPSNVVEHINDNVENMLNDIHQQSSQPGSTMQASTGTKVDALSMARSTKLVKFKTIPQKDANVQDEVKEILKCIKINEKDNLTNSMNKINANVQHKPVMEQQLLHLQALQSLHKYFKEKNGIQKF